MITPNIVDLSRYQTKAVNGQIDIDFADLKVNGIKAVIIQIGHGARIEPGAEDFIKEAHAAGLIVHAYHFYEDGVDNQVEFSIRNAHNLGLAKGAYYFLDMEGDIKGSWPEIFRSFYRNWKMNGWNAGLYASLSKFKLFGLDELKLNKIYKWVADWDADHAPGIADVWQYNCSTGLGKYTLKLDKNIDITGKLVQAVQTPATTETDINGQYEVKPGAFVGFDYSTTSIVGGKMLVSSPDGSNKIPKLGPDGSFIFNRTDGNRMWAQIKDKIKLPDISHSIQWANIIDKPDLASFATQSSVNDVKVVADNALSKAEQAQSTADANTESIKHISSTPGPPGPAGKDGSTPTLWRSSDWSLEYSDNDSQHLTSAAGLTTVTPKIGDLVFNPNQTIFIISSIGSNQTYRAKKIGDLKGWNGQDGKSAYQIWLDHGNSGTEQDFLNSLKGRDGKSSIDNIKVITNGLLSDLADQNGVSHYEIECSPSDSPSTSWGICDVYVGTHYAKQVFTVAGSSGDDEGAVYVRVRDYSGVWHKWQWMTAWN